MKITEEHLKEFFPRDMRFTHYVAKRYGYRFKNDEAVEKANYEAALKVLKLYSEGMEFDDNKHLYGFVMTTIRYAILNSFRGNANEQNLEVRPESDYIYGYDDDETSTMQYHMPVTNNSYDDSGDQLYKMMQKILNPIERQVLQLKYEKDYTFKEIANHMGITIKHVRAITYRIKNRYNSLNNRIKLQEYEYSLENKNAFKVVQQTNDRIQRQAQLESTRANKEERERYNETMSWLDIA
jgi:RNA polymerase sigma factor (sigma-70 family)